MPETPPLPSTHIPTLMTLNPSSRSTPSGSDPTWGLSPSPSAASTSFSLAGGNRLRPAGPGRYSLLADLTKGLQGPIVRRLARKVSSFAGRMQKKKLRAALRVILFNCRECMMIKDSTPGGLLIIAKYSRNKAQPPHSRRSGTGIPSVPVLTKALQLMDDLGYIEQCIEKPGSQWLSYFWPTDLLEEELRRDTNTQTVTRQKRTLLCLRDERKNSIPVPDTRKTRAMKGQLKALNREIRKHVLELRIPEDMIVTVGDISEQTNTDNRVGQSGEEVRVFKAIEMESGGKLEYYPIGNTQGERSDSTKDDRPIDPDTHPHSAGPIHLDTKAQCLGPTRWKYTVLQQIRPAYDAENKLYSFDLTDIATYWRGFCRSSMTCGGRFYSYIQSLPKVFRPFMRLDGQPLVECDFSALHPRLLYAILGDPVTEDPYRLEIPGCTDPESLRSAAKRVLLVMINAKSLKQAKNALQVRVNRGTLLLPSGVTLDGLISAIQVRHSKLKSCFFSDEGVHLQYRDSLIAERVLAAMVDAGCPLIALHDGFLCREGDKEMLTRSMTEAFLAEISVYPEIKVTPLARQEGPRQAAPSRTLPRVEGVHPFLREHWAEYRDAGRRRRSQLLDELCRIAGYHRKYAISLFRKPLEIEGKTGKRRQRSRTFSIRVESALVATWRQAGGPSSVRLKAMLPSWLPWIKGLEAPLSPDEERALLAMSPRQMDRFLAPHRMMAGDQLRGQDMSDWTVPPRIQDVTAPQENRLPSVEQGSVSCSGSPGSGQWTPALPPSYRSSI